MKREKDLLTMSAAFLLLSGISILRQIWINTGERQLSPAESVVIFFFYILVLNIWWNSIVKRIAQKNVRTYLLLGHWIMAGWIVVRLLQSCITAGAEQYGRFSGYLLGIPVAYVFLLNFYASLMLEAPLGERLKKRWYLLLIPASLLAVGLLTNDYHQFFARELPVESGPSNRYQPMVGFFVIAAWVIVLELAKIRNLFRSGRALQNKRLRWLPILELAAIILYTIPYALISFAPPRIEFMEYTIALLCYEALVWETCVLIGVLPVNTRYREVFQHSDIGMQILDPEGNIFERSRNADHLRPGQFDALKQKGSISLGSGLELHMAKIGGGYVIWHTDNGQLKRMLAELKEKQEELSDEDLLLRTELANRQEMLRVRERQRLYELIYKETEDDRKKMLSIIAKIREEMEKEAPDDPGAFSREERIGLLLQEGCDVALRIKLFGNRLMEKEYREEEEHA